MAKKHKKIESKRLPTKQQLSKWELQKKRQRLIYILGGIFFAFVLIFMGYGYYDAQIKPFSQKVLRVNDTIIDMDYYLNRLAALLPAVDPSQAPYIADTVIAGIVRDELILQR
ncbi:hypothetical protein ACFLXL_01880, partial [Chloroflexota bacterium]